MQGIKFKGYTREFGKPKDWSDDMPPCTALPLFVYDSPGGSKYYVSVWRVSFMERIRILFGHKVVLTCVGAQVPVNMTPRKIAELKT